MQADAAAQLKALEEQMAALKKQLAETSDTAARSAIQDQINATKKQIKELKEQSQGPKATPRPDGQFFNLRELVEMTIVGGGGALGGLISYYFSGAGIWQGLVPTWATGADCVIAGALAAGLTVWFVARTDRNQRVPCLLFSILCGLAGIQLIEKAAKTLMPDINFHEQVQMSVGLSKVSSDRATAANAGLQNSSAPEKVQDAKDKIAKVGDSIQNLNQALTTAKEHNDGDATQALNQSITDAAQSLAKIKLESQSIPEVSAKVEDVLSKQVPADVAKTAEQNELKTLKDRYLKIPATTGWCFIGVYNKGTWDRPITDYRGAPDPLTTTTLKVTNPVYLRDNAPGEKDYKLGEIINALFEGDEITVDKARVFSGNRVWAHVTQIKRAETPQASGPAASPAPSASTTPTQSPPENSPPIRHRARKRAR